MKTGIELYEMLKNEKEQLKNEKDKDMKFFLKVRIDLLEEILQL